MEDSVKLKYFGGDLMKFTEDAFGHGCNCFKNMRSGVAAAVRKNYFELVQADLDSTKTSEERLGTYTKTKLSNGKTGYNIYSQYNYGTNKVQVDYSALEKALNDVCCDMLVYGLKTLALPKIGCGLAGGDWNIVKHLLEKISKKTGIQITVYELK